jgi:Uma2 family endonuclease
VAAIALGKRFSYSKAQFVLLLSIASGSEAEDNRSMATHPMTSPLVPVEEYLATTYEPDCEYIEGVLEERNVGEFDHSFLQTLLAALFTVHTDGWGVYALTEQRVQIKTKNYRIPDVTVLKVGARREPILTHPPLIVIEIMSPGDNLRQHARKAEEYLGFGIEHVWVIDPSARVVFRGVKPSAPGGLALELVPSGELTVSGTPIQVRVPELFEKLDRM